MNSQIPDMSRSTIGRADTACYIVESEKCFLKVGLKVIGRKASGMTRTARSVALFISLAALVFGQFGQISPAIGAEKTFQVMSPIDQYTPSNYSAQYDLDYVEVGLYDNNSNDLHVWLHYKQPISRTMFTSNSSAWGMVAIWTSESRAILGGNDQDFRILPNRSVQYPLDNSNISADAYVPNSSGGRKTDLSKCSPVTWSNIGLSVRWIGFKISRACAGIPDKFWVAGFTTYASDKWDWAPDKALYVDLTARTTPTPNATTSASPAASATPIVKRVQNFSFSSVETQYLTSRAVNVYTNSDGGSRYVRSQTPGICDIEGANAGLASSSLIVNLYSEGICILEGYAPSTNLYFESSKSYISFQVTRSEQEVDVTIPDKPRAGKVIDIDIFSSGDALPGLRVLTPKVCLQPSKSNQYRLKLLKSGTCRFNLSDDGSEDYLPYEDVWEFDVLSASGATPKSSPSPKKSISGSASTTKVPASTPSNKPTTSNKIGGTADTKKS